jgi:type I restriction enzyme, S subunit
LLYIPRDFHNQLSKSSVRPGDIAVVRSGSVGVSCVIPDYLPEANCSDLVLVQGPHGVVPEYGAYYLNSAAKGEIRRGQSGIALIHFNTKAVAALRIAIPPLEEQKAIVAMVDSQMTAMDQLEADIDSKLRMAAAQRKNILRSAFAGHLVPQDPSDEPASALLGRIRAERALESNGGAKRGRTRKTA